MTRGPDPTDQLIEALYEAGVSVAISAELPYVYDVELPQGEQRVALIGLNPVSGSKSKYAAKLRVDCKWPGESMVLAWSVAEEVIVAVRTPKYLPKGWGFELTKSLMGIARDVGLIFHGVGGEEAVVFSQSFLPFYMLRSGDVNEVARSLIAQWTPKEPLEAVAAEPLVDKASEIMEEAARSSFNDRVMRAYDHACAFCDMQLGLNDAAHIIPRNVKPTNNSTRNGIALCASHHRAFDRLLIELTEDYRIEVNTERLARLRALARDQGWPVFRSGLRPDLRLPINPANAPDPAFIKRAREIRREQFAPRRKRKRQPLK